SVADGLAGPRRTVRDVALLPLGDPSRRERRRAARATRDAAKQAAERRADHVLLPVPRTGGLLLRRAAVPVGLPRSVRARDRRAAVATVDHAPRCRDRHPASPPER